MKTNYSALDISSFFIKKGVSPLKLQKLLYYSQLWFFVKNDKMLFNDRIQAWIYGPVIYDVWANFKFMKRSSIIPHSRAVSLSLDDLTLNHLADVWTSYGHLSGSDLVDLTHNDLPWKNSRKGLLSNQPSDKDVSINQYTTVDFALDSYNRIPVVTTQNTLGHYSNF
ncbi:MAG: Panacea domain-containing protein [Winogradskyella sp.]